MVVVKLSKFKLAEAIENAEKIQAKKLLDVTKVVLLLKHEKLKEKINAAYKNLINKQYPKTSEEAIKLFEKEINSLRSMN